MLTQTHVLSGQVAYLAFGEGVVSPTAATKEAINETVEQAKQGEIPTISLQPDAFLGIPQYKLDTVYEVELGIICAALLGAAMVSYLLQVCVRYLCGIPRKVDLSVGSLASTSASVGHNL